MQKRNTPPRLYYMNYALTIPTHPTCRPGQKVNTGGLGFETRRTAKRNRNTINTPTDAIEKKGKAVKKN